MDRRFVIISGLPGSGKTTLARELAPLLGLPVIDKDEILERLFNQKGIGDAAWRRSLSRESDAILQAEAERSSGAVLVSFWRLEGMAEGSGTPVEWLSTLSDLVVHVRCVCPAKVAAERFSQRTRHPGHLDGTRSIAEILASIEALPQRASLAIGEVIDVDTSVPVAAAAVAEDVRRVFTRHRTS